MTRLAVALVTAATAIACSAPDDTSIEVTTQGPPVSVSPSSSLEAPVADPTPDEPGPIRLSAQEEPKTELPDTDLVFDVPQAPPADGPIYPAHEVVPPEKLFAPNPVYSEMARKAGVQGVVVVQAIINKQGEVTNVKVLKGLPMGLDVAAAEAVKRWKFNPATLNGKPVNVYFNLTVNFPTATSEQTVQATERIQRPPDERRVAGDSYFGCTDREYFSRLVDYAIQNDNAAFSQALATGLLSGYCTRFTADEAVYVQDTAVFSGLVKVRRRGETAEYWTNLESLQ